MTPPDSGVPAVAVRPLTLHLGVLVQPYRTPGKKASVTTGDVARFLEDRYALMQTYYRVRGNVVAAAMEGSLRTALEALMMGRAVDPWGPASQAIQSDFREWISSRAAEQAGMAGVPTKAALRGVNHRLKHPYRSSNPRRPSFRDTGLFMNSFRSWVS